MRVIVTAQRRMSSVVVTHYQIRAPPQVPARVRRLGAHGYRTTGRRVAEDAGAI
jgi:hypothetical protein